MKRFWRTIGGKSILFLTTILCVYLVFASLIGVFVMVNWGNSFFAPSATAMEKSVIEEYAHDEAYIIALNCLYNEEMPLSDDSQTSLRTRVISTSEGRGVYFTTERFDASKMESARLSFTYYYVSVMHDSGDSSWSEIIFVDAEDRARLYPGEEAFYGDNTTVKDIFEIQLYVDEEWNGIDRVYILRQAAQLVYKLRYWIPAVGAVAFVLGLATFIALMCVTARRREDNDVHPGPITKVPLELLLIGVLLAVYVTGSLFDGAGGTVLLCILAVFWLHFGLWLCMDIAARIKAKTLFKNTLIYKIFRGIGNLFKMLPLTWKTVLILGALWLFELIVYMTISGSTGLVLVYMIFERIILFALIITGVYWMKKLQEGGKRLASGDLGFKVDTASIKYPDLKAHGEDLNSIGVGMQRAVEQQMRSERMKTELITNVSHDIKTPLTSIINYADLISKEETDNPKIAEYTEVLTRQSTRLKRLIEDLVEASRASTGNLDVVMAPCEASTFVEQISGEYEERLKAQDLTLVTQCDEGPMPIMADGRRMLRVFDNLMSNICKYAQPGTRVYLTLSRFNDNVLFTFKNTSREALNISAEELMERFVRGDRSRGTEGNGLGLSIARSLTELQGGSLNLVVDGDLFKAILRFPMVKEGATQPVQPQMMQPVQPQPMQPVQPADSDPTQTP